MKHERFIRKKLKKKYGKGKTVLILDSAHNHYQECLALCGNVSKGEYSHLKNTILPTTAVYKALLEHDNENAFRNTNDIIIGLCESGQNVLNAFLKLPGMTSDFMMMFPKMAVKMFGKECGFDYTNLSANAKLFQMDMTMCPYIKYAKHFSTEELVPIFCESDSATYGNLSKILFSRTETLGTGGNKCDFRFTRNDK